MKKILAAAILLACSFTAISQTLTEYPESGFGVVFPSKPQISKNQFDSAVGKIDMVMYMSETNDFMAMVSENKYPAELVAKLDSEGIKKLLDGAKNGALNNMATQMSAKLVIGTETNSLLNDKYPLLKSEGKIGDFSYQLQLVLRNNQMYQMLAIGDLNADSVKQFFKSFKLL
ncbi:hypothetical protein [Flavobacterium sp. 3HN19-14]|uniref:hypothetical protein n=1 Tax=Flavobacterium sp. 3HN19-14 TaxID=3448133 RepID=UPI003EDF289B